MSQQQPPQGYGPPPQGYPPGAYPQPQPKSSWFHSPLAIGLSLVVCWPFGLILLWTSPRASLVAKLVGTCVVGGFGLLLTIGMFAAAGHGKPSSTSSGTAGGREVATEKVDESCSDVSSKFGTSSKLSDLQKDEAWKGYKGKSFAWKLQITEVSAATFGGGFHVQAKCAPDSPSLIQDIQINYGNDARSFVMGLEKGKTYTLSGTLNNTSSLFGLGADGSP